MTIQGGGDYKAAKQLLTRLANIQPVVQRTLDRLATIPVDIEPVPPSTEEQK
jgi:hypothetical protein